MTTLRIPTPLRTYTGGKSEVSVSGAKISEALTDLTTQFPAIKPHLFNESGELRPFVNLFVGEHVPRTARDTPEFCAIYWQVDKDTYHVYQRRARPRTTLPPFPIVTPPRSSPRSPGLAAA